MAKPGRPRKEFYVNKSPMEPPPAPPIRTGGRLKKAKVVFDPSDAYTSKKHGNNRMGCDSKEPPKVETRGRRKSNRDDSKTLANSPEPQEMCSVCGNYETKKSKKLIFCLDCNYKVHVKCLDVDFKDALLLKENYRCDECKTCSSCYEGQEEGILVTCSDCVNSYHLDCHVPKINRNMIKEEHWVCTKCRKPTIINNETSVNVIHKEVSASSAKIDSATDIAEQVSKISLLSEKILNTKVDASENVSNTSDIPSQKNLRANKYPLPKNLPKISDIATWSTSNVVDYFRKYFPSEAFFFESNDIDGHSLLLLKRSDVVRKSGRTLGSMLALYNFILKLQKGSNNHSLSWT